MRPGREIFEALLEVDGQSRGSAVEEEKENEATSRATSEELCRDLGVDPKKYWGKAQNYLLDAFFAGQQSVKK